MVTVGKTFEAACVCIVYVSCTECESCLLVWLLWRLGAVTKKGRLYVCILLLVFPCSTAPNVTSYDAKLTNLFTSITCLRSSKMGAMTCLYLSKLSRVWILRDHFLVISDRLPMGKILVCVGGGGGGGGGFSAWYKLDSLKLWMVVVM